MIFLLDIGNTRTKAAFFDKIIQPEAALPKAWTLYDLQLLLRDRPVTGIIIAASGLIPEGVAEWLAAKEKTGTRVLFFSHETPIPVQNAYHSPQTLGKDRMAAVIGAWSFYPGRNCLIVDTGTCTTYNLLSSAGIFLGGNITPGVEMRLKAMHHFTARLPLVERKTPGQVLGLDTETSMRSGAQEGAVFEMEGFVRYYQQHYEHLQLILTGGDAVFFGNSLSIKDVATHQDLVLYGLKEIFYYNYKGHV